MNLKTFGTPDPANDANPTECRSIIALLSTVLEEGYMVFNAESVNCLGVVDIKWYCGCWQLSGKYRSIHCCESNFGAAIIIDDPSRRRILLRVSCNASTIVAGFCNVLVGESDDGEDEDDTAAHIVNMFLASLDDNTLTSEWSEFGDVVPFFSVPHSGRHVFYTQCIDSILAVGTNVASEIALVYMADASLLELT
jgi:hypothetical protein